MLHTHKAKKKKFPLKLFILFAVLVGFYASYPALKTKISAIIGGSQTVPQQAASMPAVEVNAVIVRNKKIEKTQELPARVTAYKISDVRPQVSGVIEKQLFIEGSHVKKGQPLYEIDTSIYQAAYDDAAESYKTLAAKKKRYDALVNSGAISRQEYDDVAAAYQTAKANAKKAQTNLRYANIPSPISGYVGKTNVTVGSLATANQAEVLTTVTQLDPIYVDIVQPSKELIRLGNQKGATVSLKIDGIPYEVEGVLEFSEVFTDIETDSVRLRSKFSNKNEKLLPGMFASASIHLKPFDAIAVPQKATTRNPDGSLTVWVVGEDDVAKMRQIKAEQVFGDQWIVTEGLSDGEIVIIEGFMKIAEGAKVKTVISNPEDAVIKTAEVQPEVKSSETANLVEESKLLDLEAKKPEVKAVKKKAKKSSTKTKKTSKKKAKKTQSKQHKN